MSDLIERQAAIDAMCEECGMTDECRVGCTEVDVIRKLPSAETNCVKCEWYTEEEGEHSIESHCRIREDCYMIPEQMQEYKAMIKRKSEPVYPRWIPCSERLPDKDGRYLTTNSRIGEWIVDWNIWHNEPKPSWLYNQGVIAWMPLPEPYTEEQP